MDLFSMPTNMILKIYDDMYTSLLNLLLCAIYKVLRSTFFLNVKG